MEYRIEETGEGASGEIVGRPGGGQYTIRINGERRELQVLSMDARGIEFILDQKYHSAKYLENSTAGMDMVVDGVPMKVRMHTDLDEVVFKNSGAGEGKSELALKSQIPGKVVSIPVEEGASVKNGDPIIVLESMKMQVAVKSHKDGTVKSIKVKQGGSVAKNDVIAEIE